MGAGKNYVDRNVCLHGDLDLLSDNRKCHLHHITPNSELIQEHAQFT